MTQHRPDEDLFPMSDRRLASAIGMLSVALACAWPAASRAQLPSAAASSEEHRVLESTAEPLRVRAEKIVQSSLPLLQRSADTWIQRKSCASCHHQTLGLMAVRVAGEKQFPVNEGLAAKQEAHIRRSIGRSNADFLQGIGPSTFGAAFSAWGLHLGETEDRMTPTRVVHWLTSVQQANGQLPSFSHRPPMEHRSATGTALLIHGLRRWGTHLPKAEASLDDAVAWLTAHDPPDVEAAAWRLLGLYWHGADRQVLADAATPLLESQRDDGGWRQHDLRHASDAYATGLTLAILLQTGQLTADDSRSGAAATWLVDDFDPEQSAWRVGTRRRVMGLPYFESGYPFGEDQFISYGGSAWATAALTLFARAGVSEALAPPEPADTTLLSPCGEVPPLLCSALWRSTEEFSLQVAANAQDRQGLDEQGLHLLMAAAADPDKLAAALANWDDPIDRASEVGRTALHVAVMAPRPIDAHRTAGLLLARGANVNVADEQGLTPLHLAARRADPELVQVLLRAGAKTDAVAPGIDGMTPLGAAIAAESLEVVQVLLEAGADPKIAMTAYGSDALQEAVFAGSAEIVELLLSLPERAQELVTLSDVDGWTAAHYLFLQPFGGRRIAELVLDAKPDLNARDSERRSVRDWAKREGLEELLEARTEN